MSGRPKPAADGFWLRPEPLLLASTSAIRRRMLAAAGIPVETRRAAIDERLVEAPAREKGVPPAALARLLAREKAMSVAQAEPARLVIGADQALDAAGHSGSKAADLTEAKAQLRTLSGRAHALHSAVCVACAGRPVFEAVTTARLTMRPLSEAFLDRYLQEAHDAALSSVGGYQLEGLGIQLFERIEGDYFTILGMPLLPLLDFLRRSGHLAS